MVTRLHLLASLQRVERLLPSGTPSLLEEVRRLIREARDLPRVLLETQLPPLRAFRPRAPKPQPVGRPLPPPPRAKPLLDRLKGVPHLRLLPSVPRDPKAAPPDYLGEKMRQAEGARALLLEIVRRAAYDWVLYRSSRRLDQKVLAEDAYTWLFQEDEHHPNWALRRQEGKDLTALVNICVELDLDVERVRAHIRNLTPNKVMSSGRPPENSRASDHSPSIKVHTSIPDDLGGGDSFDFDSLLNTGGGGDD